MMSSPSFYAICGAKEVAKAPPKSYVPMIEYCVAGHHSGLPDGGTKVDGEEDSTLHGRMKRKTGDYSAYENEVKLEYPKDNLRELFDVSNQREIIERYSFFTRYPIDLDVRVEEVFSEEELTSSIKFHGRDATDLFIANKLKYLSFYDTLKCTSLPINDFQKLYYSLLNL